MSMWWGGGRHWGGEKSGVGALAPSMLTLQEAATYLSLVSDGGGRGVSR